MKTILSIKAGPSSVKVSVYKTQTGQQPPIQIARVQIASLDTPPPTLTYHRGSKISNDKPIEGVGSPEDAFERIVTHLFHDSGLSEVSREDDVAYTCHLIAHGGDYTDAYVIDSETYHHLEELTDLAPLHNASALVIVRFCTRKLKKAKNIAYFDSSFHATIPAAVRTFPIDPKKATNEKLRKYGFHGISYAFITRSVADFLGKEPKDTSIIALHLGSRSSACAIKNGQSLDTSMGLTPLDGLPGATGTGSIDPSLIFHLTRDAGEPSPRSTTELPISKAEEILNKKCGWKALTGTTDFGKISSSPEPESRLAFDLLVDRIVGFIGSHYVRLEGCVDALVFAGGIGEKGTLLRERVLEKCQCLGFELDKDMNETSVDDIIHDIGAAGARHQTLVCQTDEQFEMARQCALSLDT